MHSNLKTFNTIRLYKSWTIFWRFLLIFFIFLIQFHIWEIVAIATVRYRYRPAAVTTVTAVTTAVISGKKTCYTLCRRDRHGFRLVLLDASTTVRHASRWGSPGWDSKANSGPANQLNRANGHGPRPSHEKNWYDTTTTERNFCLGAWMTSKVLYSFATSQKHRVFV
jgi:hypothetical protein